MKSKFILLVDDDENDTELIQRAFNKINYSGNIHIVNDGVEALDFLNCAGAFSGRVKANPAAIIMDKKMPRMDGIEALNVIKRSKNLKHIPVIMFTSSKYEQDVIDSYENGANAYIVKPINTEDFYETVKLLAQFWGEKNELPMIND